jgi:MFS family permease
MTEQHSKGGFNYRSDVFLIIWTLNFLFTFSNGLIPTPRAYLTKAFLGNVEAATMQALGIMASIGSAAATVGYFIGGFGADTLGKKKIVAASFVILAAGCLLFIFAPTLPFLFLASFVEFFAVGFSSPAIAAIVASCSDQDSRGVAYGAFNLSWIASGVAAPLLAGLIAQFLGLHTPFILAVSVSLAGLFFSSLIRGGNHDRKPKVKRNGKADATGLQQGLILKRMILIFCITNLLNGLLNGFINPVVNGMLLFKLTAAPAEYGLVLSLASSLVTGLVQLPGGKLTDRFGRKPLTLFGFLGAPMVLLLGFSRSLIDFSFIVGGISAVGNISSPAISAWLMDLVPEHRRASVSGITQTLNGIGLTIGPNAGSYVWNSTKPDAATPSGIAALIFAAAFPFYLMLKEPEKNPTEA